MSLSGVVHHPLLVWCGCSTLSLCDMLPTILVWLVCTVLVLSAIFYTTLVWCDVQNPGLVWCALSLYGLEHHLGMAGLG